MSAVDDWHERFLKESEENARLRLELEETRAKYDTLLEASLQQMASRDEFSSRPTLTASTINVSSTNLPTIETNKPATNNTTSDDTHPLSTSLTSTGSKTSATPKKDSKKDKDNKDNKDKTSEEKGGKSIFRFGGGKNPKGKQTQEKPKPDGLDPDESSTAFVLPLPSTSYQHLPRLKVQPLVAHNHVVVCGPNGPVGPFPSDEAGTANYTDIAAGRSISTYPHIPGNPGRDGDPIADRFATHVFENRVIAAVADGCNWGAKPREAAQKANAAFIEYVNASHDAITDVKKAGAVLLNAFEHAHNSIMEGKNAFWDAGTTTLLGGVLLEIIKGDDKWTPQWEFVCASVGDCKAFCYSTGGEIVDITQGNRPNTSDPRDCGGRLGPHDEGKPDLRNLNLFCASCEDGDLIIIVSDGIHDNLDPQHLGKLPREMPKEFNLVGEKWEDVDPAKAIYAKNAYTTDLLLKLLKKEDEMPTPREVADRLVNHCITVTQKSRDYMENNMGKRLPEDYVEYPGKMDHTTCLCFRVGRIPNLPEKGMVTSGSSTVTNGAVPSLPVSAGLSISTTSPLANSNGIGKPGSDDGSPRPVGSPTSASNAKFGWTPSIKHSN